MRLLRTALLCTLCIFFMHAGNTTTHAQILSNDGLTNPLNLIMSPTSPEPGERVTLTINDYSINSRGAVTQWFIDGEEITTLKNERTAYTTAGISGSSKEVLVISTLPNGSKLRASIIIAPIRVDMLVEADTITPAFYKGRSIPSVGSSVRVTAVPFAEAGRAPESYSYLWSIDNDVYSGGSRFGKNTIQFNTGFGSDVTVSVDIIDTDGSTVATDRVTIPLQQPELHFYDINPLRGMSEIALSKESIVVGDEIQVRAEPYYINKSLLTNKPHIEWELNNVLINNQNEDLQQIVLRKQGSSGKFKLSFHIRNLAQLLQGVEDSITLKF